EALRDLVSSQLAPAKRAQFIFRHRRIGLDLHRSSYRLAPSRIRNSKDLGDSDSWGFALQEHFDLACGNVFTTGLNDVLQSAAVVGVSFFIHRSEVTRVEEAVSVHHRCR